MSYDYLDDERKKLWLKIKDIEELMQIESKKQSEKFQYIEKLIKERTPDIETEARENLNKTNEYFGKIHEMYESVLQIDNTLKNDVSYFEKVRNEVSACLDDSTRLYNEINEVRARVGDAVQAINGWHVETQEKYDELKAIYSNNPELEKKLNDFNSYCIELDDVSSKIKSTHQSILKRKSEIDEVYYSIFGYVDKNNETGAEVHIDGLKDELQESFDKLKAELSSYHSSTAEKYQDLIGKIGSFEDNKTKEYKEVLEQWGRQYQSIVDRITELLPKALTAGLSYAFSEKKNDEILESRRHAKAFTISILSMVVISFLPIAVSIHSLLNSITLQETILRLPRLVLGILPLYIPVLWFAYSANKKLNLSKRLVEEYSHKEALSKTYEGLSKQIEHLERTCGVEHLKEKLLFNMLEVSAENPGKLISDYNKSDHPLMDALDKSIKLSNSIERLSRIPGFARIATVMSARANKIIEDQQRKAENGLAASSDEEPGN